MARARFIRPEFFTDTKVSDLPFGACMLFAGIWCHSDLRGVFEHDPRVLRGLIFPMRDGIDIVTVGQWLEQLEAQGMIVRFESGGKAWGYVSNWDRYQQISNSEKKWKTPRPEPPTNLPKHVPRPGSEHAQANTPTPTPTPTPTATPARARNPPQPDDGMFDQGPIGKPLGARNFADWNISVGKRIFLTREEMDHWKILFEAEGWDEMTRGYNHLATKKPEPQKIFLSDFQGIR